MKTSHCKKWQKVIYEDLCTLTLTKSADSDAVNQKYETLNAAVHSQGCAPTRPSKQVQSENLSELSQKVLFWMCGASTLFVFRFDETYSLQNALASERNRVSFVKNSPFSDIATEFSVFGNFRHLQ